MLTVNDAKSLLSAIRDKPNRMLFPINEYDQGFQRGWDHAMLYMEERLIKLSPIKALEEREPKP